VITEGGFGGKTGSSRFQHGLPLSAESSHPATSWSAAQVRPYSVIRTKRSMPSPPIVNGAPDDREPLDVIMSLLPAKDEINSPSATQDCIRDA